MSDETKVPDGSTAVEQYDKKHGTYEDIDPPLNGASKPKPTQKPPFGSMSEG